MFSSQHLHGGPQLSATPVPGYRYVALSWIPQTLHLYTFRQTITHTIKTNVNKKQKQNKKYHYMWPTPTIQNKMYCCLRVDFSLLRS